MVSIHPIQAAKTAGSNIKAKVSNMSKKQKAAAVIGTVAVAGALTAAYISGKHSFINAKNNPEIGFLVNGKGNEIADNFFNRIRVGFMNFGDSVFQTVSNKAAQLKDLATDKWNSIQASKASKNASKAAEGAAEGMDNLINKPEGFEEAIAEGIEKAGEAVAEAADKAQ